MSLVLAAVKPHGSNDKVLKLATQLCGRTGQRLRLVAVVEIDDLTGFAYAAGPAHGRAMLESLIAEREQDARAYLDGIAARYDLGAPITTAVVRGRPAQGVLAEAVTSGAALVVSGAAGGRHRFVPRGFSTALGLMSEATLPVLVVPDAARAELAHGRLKVLVADDLETGGDRAVKAAFELATALRDTDVDQVHVSALSVATLERAFARVGKSDDSPTTTWDRWQKALDAELRRRAPDGPAALAGAGGHYNVTVLSGDTLESLDKVIEAASPDLVVFGRHVASARRPFAGGRVPFHVMMAHPRPFMVVPPA